MIRRSLFALAFVLVLLASSTNGQVPLSVGDKETGIAAVYADSLNGHKTASGQVFDQTKLTAAHKTLPFGSKIKVTNTKNGKSVVVRINDRGPAQSGRILDLSTAAAQKLGIGKLAMHEVTLEVLEVGDGKTVRQAANH
jgi:rare lipoprotein A